MDIERKELIDALTENYEELIKEIKPVFKCNILSEKARKEGNKLYLSKNHPAHVHEDIFYLYCKSVALAVNGSENLAFAYGNRSAFLLHVGRYEESIKDIEKAIKITFSNALKIKLLCRKAECFNYFKVFEGKCVLKEAETLLNEIDENDKNKQDLIKLVNRTKVSLKNAQPKSKTKDQYKKMEILKNLNEKIDISKSIKNKYSKKYGRHLVVTRDFSPGEIIFVEKFYASCLNLNKMLNNCERCLKICWSGIPCDHCSWAMFCSEQCKKEAVRNYHDIECCLISYVKIITEGVAYEWQLCIRLLLMALKEYGNITNLKTKLNSINNYSDTAPVMKDQFFKHKFSNVYRLQSFSSKMPLYSKITSIILFSLVRYTSIFGEPIKLYNLEDLLKNEDIIFIGTLLLKIYKIKHINNHHIKPANYTVLCKHPGDSFVKKMELCCGRGSCLALASSLINHSCTPNVRRCYTEDQRVIIYAVSPIARNSQIFVHYSPDFFETPKIQRQIRLSEFQFTCDCEACQNNWPTLQESNFSKEFIDTKLFKSIPELTMLHLSEDSDCNLEVVQKLSSAIKKAVCEPPFSPKLYFLYLSLEKAFNRIYSLKTQVFNSCTT